MGGGSARPVRSQARSLALVFALGFAPAWLLAQPVAARRGGIAAQGCNGCHQGGSEPGLRLTATPANPAPGQRVAIALEIDAVNGSVGGFYLVLEGAGTLSAPAGSGIREFTPGQLGHSAPKSASGGVVRFNVEWTAPASAGGVIFRAWAVSGNGDDRSAGDGASETELLVASGCAGELYAIDPDGDGYGAAELGRKRDCSLPAGYSQRDGDCAEYDPAIHPDAPEQCNTKDDDCDGKSDEALPIGPQYVDSDGDGHGDIASSMSIQACSSPKGYAAARDDCNDRAAAVHPGAQESCDYMDEDCDGRSDENARAACGVGWCRRLADSCNLDLCTPGKPRAEECNAFDDDCDERADEDAKCPAGQRCNEGRCQSASEAAAGQGGASGAAGASSAGAGASSADAGTSAQSGGGADGVPAAGNAPGTASHGVTGASGGSASPSGDPAEVEPRGDDGGCSIAAVGTRARGRGIGACLLLVLGCLIGAQRARRRRAAASARKLARI